ncbi:MAG: hypothetical protein R3199_09150 [Gemmatimonadota bacterium]|nr:hypothetical protein [Gemmatimonadota bacterium]
MNAYVREYRKIERRARRRDNFLLRYLPIVLMLAGVVVVGKIYLQSLAIDWSRRTMERKDVVRDLELRNDELRRTIAGLSTRERLTREAGERLGMVSSTEESIVWLPVTDRSSGEAASRSSPDERAGTLATATVATVRTWLDALWQEEALALTRP